MVDRPGVPQTELRFGGPGVRLDDPDHAPLTLWSYTVGMGGMSNRMMARVRTELGLAYGVGCLYSAALPRRGSFYAYCATRNDAVAQAVSEMIDVITATGADLIPDDELEAARNRLLASHVFRYDTSAEVLSRALTLDLFGYPTDFWERNLEAMSDVDNMAVGSAIRRRMPPARFLIVAVGPADEIMAQLESVSEVELLKPDAPLASAEDEVADMLAAMGGADNWARLNTVHVKLTAELIYPSGSAFVPVEQHRRFEPSALRMRQTTPTGASYTSIITEGPCYLKSPTGVSEVEAEQAATHRAQMHRWLYFSLSRLANGDPLLEAGLDEEGRLVLSDPSGRLAWIELAEDNRPAKMGVVANGAEKVYTYSDWTEASGLWYAATFSEGETQVVRISLWEPYVELGEELFEL